MSGEPTATCTLTLSIKYNVVFPVFNKRRHKIGEDNSWKWDPGTNLNTHYMFIKSLLSENKTIHTKRLFQFNYIMKTKVTTGNSSRVSDQLN